MGKSFLAVLISGVLFNAADAADSQPLRIGWVYALANAPALIAEKEGFYHQEGLTVELKSFGDVPSSVRRWRRMNLMQPIWGRHRYSSGFRAGSRGKLSLR